MQQSVQAPLWAAPQLVSLEPALHHANPLDRAVQAPHGVHCTTSETRYSPQVFGDPSVQGVEQSAVAEQITLHATTRGGVVPRQIEPRAQTAPEASANPPSAPP